MTDLAYPLRQAFLRKQSRFWAGWYRAKTWMGVKV